MKISIHFLQKFTDGAAFGIIDELDYLPEDLSALDPLITFLLDFLSQEQTELLAISLEYFWRHPEVPLRWMVLTEHELNQEEYRRLLQHLRERMLERIDPVILDLADEFELVGTLPAEWQARGESEAIARVAAFRAER